MSAKDIVLGAASGGAAAGPTYVDDVFSTYLYTGNSATQTINNGIDLAGKGGLVWRKIRSSDDHHRLSNTATGIGRTHFTNLTNAMGTGDDEIKSFNSNGFTMGLTDGNLTGSTYTAWTFRKAAKFFDVVTYTGNGVAGRTVAHSLGVAPGMVIVKSTSAAYNWMVLHRSMTAGDYIRLNSGSGTAPAPDVWNSTAATDTAFTVGTNINTNELGQTYVAYLFAHDTSSTGIIQCGAFTNDGSGNATVNLGWESQYVMVKCASSLANWAVFDNMRGMPVGNTNVARLFPNTPAAETLATDYDASPNATGFKFLATGYPSGTFIYMAIRRPNKPPTSGTQVFSAHTWTQSGGL
jgi:hypothetical protein